LREERQWFEVILIVRVIKNSGLLCPAATPEENRAGDNEKECQTTNYTPDNRTDWTLLLGISVASVSRRTYVDIVHSNQRVS
jgi:hypothetical protein